MAMTGHTVPPGWNYNAMYDGYVNVQGLKISKLDVINHGGIVKAIIAIHGPQALQMATGHISQASVQNGGLAAQTIDNLSVGNAQSYAFHQPPTSVIAIETKVGRISVDIDTGDITVPVGIGRDEAIREFWFGFQKHFVSTNKSKYEKEIADLKSDIVKMKDYYGKALDAADAKSCSAAVKKIRAKYGSEKFIMVKPEDLIAFIEKG